MQRSTSDQKYFSVPDFVIFCLIATGIYSVFAIAKEWRAEFHPVTNIDLSIWALPYYTLLSATRGVVAYFISLSFTLVVGFIAAKSSKAERVIIPLLDILQSIPVLGFLPGLLLGLVALFPRTNIGLELAAIIMIFTGQVWNMVFSYYSSLKSIPVDMKEASTVMGLSWRQTLLKVELPFSAVNLAWNSLLSMAGGWFFLIPCEAITLGDREYRLPGIGAYMDVAIKQGDSQAITMAVIAMISLIILMDFFIWRPILSWVQKYRLEQVAGTLPAEPLMQIWIRESKIVRWITVTYREYVNEFRVRSKKSIPADSRLNLFFSKCFNRTNTILVNLKQKKHFKKMTFCGEFILFAIVLSLTSYGAFRLLQVLVQVPLPTWGQLIRDAFYTFFRVVLALTISTAWAVPVGIWIGISPKRIRFAQPIIQIMASFPAPMLYPLVLGVLFSLGVSFDWGAMLLMLLGVQWYVLFNVLAGALRISQELSYALSLMKASRWDRWKTLYLPSIFPPLATGWITAAGGAWNASVVAEYLYYQGGILQTKGIGARLSVATANEDFPLFAASLTLMVVFVILLNRFVWSRIYTLAQTRFKMDT